MKIIHCADIHLDSKMESNLTKEKARERKAELLTTFQRMIGYAEAHDVSAILIAGDLFDTKRISATARNVVYQSILQYPQISFYYLQGNHDEGSFLSQLPEIPENLYTFNSDLKSYVLCEGKKKIVLTAAELTEENKGAVYNKLALNQEDINLVMFHGQEGEDVLLPMLKDKGIDYLALGHIHGKKEERLDSRAIYCYPGCLEGRGFDECGEHGFMLLTVQEETGKISREFVRFARRILYTVDVDISGCMNTVEILECMRQELIGQDCEESGLVKFRLIGQVDVECEKDLQYLQKQFEDSFYFVKVVDESGYRIDYKQFEKEVSLKGEFVRTVMNRDELSEEEKATIIRYGILALAGEEID